MAWTPPKDQKEIDVLRELKEKGKEICVTYPHSLPPQGHNPLEFRGRIAWSDLYAICLEHKPNLESGVKARRTIHRKSNIVISYGDE